MHFADKIPYKETHVIPAVGNSANAAVSASRLGLKSALISNLGDDYFGKECLDVLKKEKVATEFIKINKGYKTNYHYVLWYDDDRTILIKHEMFPYEIPDIDEPNWVYLSSVGENSENFHQKIEEYFKNHPKIKLVFQPGTHQIKMGRKKLAGIYERSDVMICNKEEAQRILETGDTDIKILLKKMRDIGPKIVVITDGPEGAYASDGRTAWFMPPYPDPKPPYERTGAGDAFSSAFVVGLCLLGENNIPEALRWAPINAMSVVQYIGAREGLLTRDKLEDYLKKAPAGYKPRKIS